MNINDAMLAYLDDVGNKRSQATKRAYANGINALKEHFRDRKIELSSPIETISIENIINFPSHLGKNGYSKKTTGNYLSGVKGFVNWMIIVGFIDPNPKQWLRLQKSFQDGNRIRESRLPRYPKKDDVAKMISAVRSINFPGELEKLRNIAIIEFLASTGCRNEEICKLIIRNVDLENRSAIVTGKGNKERVVFFSKDAKKSLENYWGTLGNADPISFVFRRHDRGAGKKMKRITTTTVRNVIHSVKEAAGIDKFTPHYFRHAFAIKMLRETSNLALVQDLMGHSDPAATRVYAKISEEDLRDAHRAVYG